MNRKLKTKSARKYLFNRRYGREYQDRFKESTHDNLQADAAAYTIKSYKVSVAGVIISVLLALITIYLACQANRLANQSIALTKEIDSNDHDIDTLHRIVEALQRHDSVLNDLLDSTIRQNALMAQGLKESGVQTSKLTDIGFSNLHSLNFLVNDIGIKWGSQMFALEQAVLYLNSYYRQVIRDTAKWNTEAKINFFKVVDSVVSSQMINIQIANVSLQVKWFNALVGVRGILVDIQGIRDRGQRAQISNARIENEINFHVRVAFPGLLGRLEAISKENGDNFSSAKKFLNSLDINNRKR